MPSIVNEQTFPTRERILRHLMLHGATLEEKYNCTIKNISKVIGLSSNVIWNHLVSLEREGVVKRVERHGKTGRPALVFSLTDKGFELFPKSYMELSIQILNEINELHGEDEIKRIFSNIGKKLAENVQKQMSQVPSKSTSMKAKLTALVSVLREHGTFHELLEDKDSFALKNYNCLSLGVVKINPLVCTIDETLIEEIFSQIPIKEKCIGDGDEFCVFRLKK
ncbi:MAG: helix-turn-helix transcriptional regulator [Candidatus Hodarchaeales archaeon]|jgi:predicted ArsR family transcriptional regulator